jgi:hypothetical protein
MVPIILSDCILSSLDNEWWYSNVEMGHYKTRGPALFLMQRNLWPAQLLCFYSCIKGVLWRQYKLRTRLVLSACFKTSLRLLKHVLKWMYIVRLPLTVKCMECYTVHLGCNWQYTVYCSGVYKYRGYAVTLLDEALPFKSEGRGFNSRWVYSDFSWA